MKLPHFSATVGLVLFATTGVSARQLVPIEDFARTPQTSFAKLSPDGKHFAYIGEYNNHRTLHVATLGERRVLRLNLGPAVLLNDAEKDVGAYDWVSDHRLIITTTVWDMVYGVIAVDSDGQHGQPISGYEDNRLTTDAPLFNREVIHRFFNQDSDVLMLDRHEVTPGPPNRPDILRVSTENGSTSLFLKNPGDVARWAADADGVVRFGILTHGELVGATYRASAQAPWKTILPLKQRTGGLVPIGFDTANNRILLQMMTEQKRWTIFPMEPATGEIGPPLFSDPEYDILPQHFIPRIDGHALCSALLSPNKDALLGVRYVTDAPRVKWFDREMGRMQAAVDRAAKDTVNLLVDISRDGKRMLWFGYSDQNPGCYYLADLEKHSFNLLAPCSPWINPAQMAPMLAVKYTARDGLVIHGFLTVPVGHEPKNLPLVVLPHGGPWVRDVWGYDPLVQLLANRGYAVLQMNYRGSPGYGEELYATARRQIGRQIQDDIEDATRWAISAGVADPKRIAICGASYGGYSALFALGHNPELYRCGISMAGVTDWPALYNSSDVAEYKLAAKHWREEIGDPKNDGPLLAAISPVNFADKIVAPVLLIQGKEDKRVPPDQAKRMITALTKQGRKPQTLFLSGVGHNFGREKSRVEIYRAVTAFLAENLGPGVD